MSLRPKMRWGGVPMLLVLSACAVGFSTAWSRERAKTVPPNISGYSWEQHSNALLVTYPPDDCGCADVDNVVALGLKHGADVVIASAEPQEELETLRVRFGGREVRVITNADSALVERFSPHKNLGLVRVVDGRIICASEGGTPSESFFKKL